MAEYEVQIAEYAGKTIRAYLGAFNDDMTTAELIGAYRKLILYGIATDEEECKFLDLIDHTQAY